MKNMEEKYKYSGSARTRRSQSRNCNFYFIEPSENVDARHLAKELININGVDEVFVTDGDYGFIVRAKQVHEKKDSIYNYLAKRFGGNLGKVTSHYQFRKIP